jgi:hypothetical protein
MAHGVIYLTDKLEISAGLVSATLDRSIGTMQ